MEKSLIERLQELLNSEGIRHILISAFYLSVCHLCIDLDHVWSHLFKGEMERTYHLDPLYIALYVVLSTALFVAFGIGWNALTE
jgi:hypothetical protein